MGNGSLFLQTATDHDLAVSSVNFLKGFIQASDPNDATAALDCLTNLTRFMEYQRSDVERMKRRAGDDEFMTSAVLEALAPFVAIAILRRNAGDDHCYDLRRKEEPDGEAKWIRLDLAHVRNLLRAAGLFTDEMQARPPNPRPDLKPEGASPPVEGEIG